ncbi:ROK family glucokinase [Kribbella sandramycini]|uniref:Glucokinase n=1 Tax=Kribbella sandramycini TaxID=60450 RepID=A0A7Y4KUQ9_9ACTN|nr:ROK family glucokinase [Kribbella sandramycini]MBB6568522.1 glucokinase [Kribbella sandramycini]NOL38890.1 ROK family glucokinase [Kribbella sandramycini]
MGLSIGIDVGGTKIAAGVVDDEGAIIARAHRDTPADSVDATAAAICAAAAELIGEHEIEAVGIGAAGFVSSDRSTVLFAPNLAWRDEPLGARVAAELKIPVVVENDANAAAWGEFAYGAAKHVEHMVCVTVGTGIGGGVVSESRLLRGAHGVAAELGHMRVVPGGHRCGCGARGCWEQYASGRALVREGRAQAESGSPAAAQLLSVCGITDPADLTGPMITAAATNGDPLAVELLEDLGRWLGEGLASIATLWDPSVVVIGGGVSAAEDLILTSAQIAFEKNLPARSNRPHPTFGIALLGNDAGLIGAADLARIK